MGHVLVAGSVNVDRIWRLAAPLRAGERLTRSEVTLRCGGGGFNTGAALLALGHRVTLVATLSTDAAGAACRARLEAMGFDLRYLSDTDAPTVPLDLLVDPTGERTIIAPATTEARLLTALPAIEADIAYINVRRTAPGVLEALAARTQVVAQMPLEHMERRPAQVLIASAADHALFAGTDAFAHARAIGGEGLAALVLTQGAGPVELCEAQRRMSLAVPPRAVPGDTTGAGDAFAAGFIDGWLAGAPLPAAVRRGIAIAGRVLAGDTGFERPAPLPLTTVLVAAD
ncbi:carbohydrate kinase family protein [Ancylobacter rudongensis]|uniref:Sugar or nucleoside kinase, ribokinase family n=1 Tax=Ancylobacter rudongensis TaxID=177413 RepID=A0A1G4SJU6_9HYPH|nr:PfkB family carbohydrate kinase [Ancylobacter rudongensis]SCW69502.1 Sugar or nucleoside kinase, ribokinase family [Ancylobacter rudongensis]